MRKPTFVITGFLGSGKTTLLNRLLKAPGLADTAVVINEFGAVPIDHLLVESAIENTVVLQNGCICCSIRGDLVDTLADLEARQARGDLPAYARVIVETTGLADVAPILQTVLHDPHVTRGHVLGGVIATVDAVNGAGQLRDFREAVRQAALADVLVVTKGDLAQGESVAALERELRGLNPAARILRAAHGAVDAAALFEGAGGAGAHPWLDVAAIADDGAGGMAARRHDGIRSFCLVREEPIAPAVLQRWLGSLTSLRGRDLLRVKGVVNLAGAPGPLVIQAAQHVVHPLARLPSWPDSDRRTRIVFITHQIEQVAIERSLDALARAEAGA